MKKLFSVLLCIVMMLSVCAFAETTTQTVEGISGLFTFVVPEGCWHLTQEELTEIMSDDNIEASREQLGDAMIEQLASYMDMLSQMDMVYGPDMSGNFNCYALAGTLTTEMLTTYVTELGDQLMEQYAQMGYDRELMDYKGLVYPVEGGMPWIEICMTLVYQDGSNCPQHQYISADASGNMYYFTFSNFDEAVEAEVMASVVIK